MGTPIAPTDNDFGGPCSNISIVNKNIIKKISLGTYSATGNAIGYGANAGNTVTGSASSTRTAELDQVDSSSAGPGFYIAQDCIGNYLIQYVGNVTANLEIPVTSDTYCTLGSNPPMHYQLPGQYAQFGLSYIGNDNWLLEASAPIGSVDCGASLELGLQLGLSITLKTHELIGSHAFTQDNTYGDPSLGSTQTGSANWTITIS